jgi:hypothetical protein
MKWLLSRIICTVVGHAQPIRMAIIGGFRCSRCDMPSEAMEDGYVSLDRPQFERSDDGNFMRHRRDNIRLFKKEY